MNISDKNHRFEDERALLIVTGRQVGRIFFARNGRIAEMEGAFVPTAKYSDREGHFARSGKGQTYGFGSVYEPKDQEAKKKFLKEFSGKIKKAMQEKKADALYIFSPNYEITELKESLPNEAEPLIRYSFMGNFVKFAPEEPLQKITSRIAGTKEKNQLLRPTEAKIMEKPPGTPLKASRTARNGRS